VYQTSSWKWNSEEAENFENQAVQEKCFPEKATWCAKYRWSLFLHGLRIRFFRSGNLARCTLKLQLPVTLLLWQLSCEVDTETKKWYRETSNILSTKWWYTNLYFFWTDFSRKFCDFTEFLEKPPMSKRPLGKSKTKLISESVTLVFISMMAHARLCK